MTSLLFDADDLAQALPSADDVCWIGEQGPSLEQLAGLSKFTALRALAVTCPRGTPEAFAALLRQHPRLERLVLAGFSALGDAHLEALGALPLRMLSLGKVGATTGDFFAALGGLEALRLSRAPLPSARGWAGLRSLRALELVDCALTAEDVERIAALPALEHLLVTSWEAPVARDALVALRRAPRLRHAVLKVRPPSRAEGEALAANPALRALVVSLDDATKLDGVRALGAFRGTLGLTLVHRHQLSDAVLEQLPELVPEVAALDFDQHQIVGLCKKVTPKGVRALGGLRALRWLHLRGMYTAKLSNEDLSFLPALPALEALSVGAVGKVTAKLFDTLAQLPRLRSLDVSWNPVSDAALKKLVGLPLESLFLYDAPLSDKGFANIAQLGALERLSVKLAKGSLSDKGLAALASLPRLRELRLASFLSTIALTDLAPLARLPALERFEYGVNSATALPDAWLPSLLPAPSLQRVDFPNGTAPACTPELVSALLAAPAVRSIGLDGWSLPADARAQLVAHGRPNLVRPRWSTHEHLQPTIRRFGDDERLPFDDA